ARAGHGRPRAPEDRPRPGARRRPARPLSAALHADPPRPGRGLARRAPARRSSQADVRVSRPLDARPQTMKRTGIAGLGLAALLLAGGAAWWWQQADGNGAPQYRTAPVGRGDIVSTVSASGTINPVGSVSVGSQISGQL